ncbi:MAG TPA: hypothetical protein VGR21_05830 [Cryptosporangiaceae bacterium]|nr:hypothetical protein [Cryptosporangiaceae bacterium]
MTGPSESRSAQAAVGTTAQTVKITETAVFMGQYLEMPFQVPAGVNRIDVAVAKSGGDAVTGVGLFDHRGTDYQSAGFRGIYG